MTQPGFDPGPLNVARDLIARELERRRRFDWTGARCLWAPTPWAPHYVPPVHAPDGSVSEWRCTHARPEQLPPDGDWFVWLIQAGRGWGKTRTGAETVRAWARDEPGIRIALIAVTFADGRDTMVEGESGLLAVTPPAELRGGGIDTAWNRSTGELYFANGSRARIYSSERPRQLRGPQHHKAWGDEPAHWLDAADGDVTGSTWSNAKFGLRLGRLPQAIMTTTPRPVRLLTGTRERPGIIGSPGTIVTRGASYANMDNLSPTYKARVLAPYEGTRLARQEIAGEILEDTPGALWKRASIIVRPAPVIVRNGVAEPDLPRVAVAVDPNASNEEGADEAGVVVGALGSDGIGYVLDDRSTADGPLAWAKRALQAAQDYKADVIVAEANNGGEMVRITIEAARRDMPDVWRGPIELVTASRGKRTRAEPVAMLYEQSRIFHVRELAALEDQLTSWLPESGDSPDRLDALVWAMTWLMLGQTDGWGTGKRGSAVA